MTTAANRLLLGDCLEKMNEIADSSVDLIYLDPPFFTERKHKLKNRQRTKEFSFDDIWKQESSYAEFLHQRILKMRDLLKDTGSIFVHCDKMANHIVRGVLDDVFGSEFFQSEIIWQYKRWSNAKKGLLPSHQNIYFFSKTSDFSFNKIFMPYSEATNLDQILQRRTRDKHNKSIYARDEEGNIQQADAKQGVPLSDVWDIPYLNPKAKERVGYPTQKPLLLLERIIELVTNENDLVLDPFCGSGTTCVAASLTNRKYIGIDQSEDAIQLSQSRLDKPIKTESHLLKKGRKSFENANLGALQCLAGIDYNPVHRNQGIDAILVEHHQGAPVLVKIQKDTETLTQAVELLSNAMIVKASKMGFLIKTRVALGEVEAATELSFESKSEDFTIHVLETIELKLKRNISGSGL
ncbi:DNA methylase N-4/N-6 domain protein [Glaciecola nitratireducens FR1064]|uniref:Methyltransferase n=2 Tax=Brumicola TaxID=3160924 RepID=G4QIZ0_GLANF|nr:DNA methylase N-4/N-6 domain protein [Glaciecola nitratireducens FR1064]